MRCTASPPPTWPPAAPAHPGIGTSTRCRSPTCSWRCAGSSSPPNICQVRWSSPLQQKSSRCSVPGQPPQHEPRKSSYKTCKGKYALSVPFCERLFGLAKKSDRNNGAGWIGQITAKGSPLDNLAGANVTDLRGFVLLRKRCCAGTPNSFMKREFGRKLAEFLANSDLIEVIDTAGAYIPGHGIPTIIMVCRPERSAGRAVRTVLGIQAEPSVPPIPALGAVWTSITENIDKPGVRTPYVTVVDLPREHFSRHPWTISGGGSVETFESIEKNRSRRLRQVLSDHIGPASFPGQDEPFFLTRQWFVRHGVPHSLGRPLIIGEAVRDRAIRPEWTGLVPYGEDQSPLDWDGSTAWARHLWRYQAILGSTKEFDGSPRGKANTWWTWYRWLPERYRTALSVTFAFVATHNHIALDRGGRVFNR